MFGEVCLIPAPEVTQVTLVGLFPTVHQHVPSKDPFVCCDKAALLAAMDFFIGMEMANMLLELHGVKSGEGAKVTT